MSRTRISYSEPIAIEVCRRIRQGQSLHAIGRDPQMPSHSAIHLWRRRLPGFAAELAKAQAIHAALAGAQHRYLPELGEAVCARLVAGETLAAICAEPQMPPLSTLYAWLQRHADFAARYEQARAMRREAGTGAAFYAQEVAEAFLARIVAGEPVAKVCARPGMPAVATLYDWLARRPDFARRYGEARELRRAAGETRVQWSEAVADEICQRLEAGESLAEISRDPTLPAQDTVQRWRRTRPDFAERFDEAVRLAGEMIEDQMRCVINTVTPETAAADRVRLAGLVSLANRLDKKPPARPPEELVIRFVDANGDPDPYFSQ